MVNFNTARWMVFALTTAVMVSVATTQEEKIDGAIDIVGISSMTHVVNGTLNFHEVPTAYIEFFANHFDFSNSKTQLAIAELYNSDNVGPILITEKVVLNLTNDLDLINQTLANWIPIIHHQKGDMGWFQWNMGFAFKAIDEIIFASDDSQRGKVVIIGLSTGTIDSFGTFTAAQKLCNRGVHIYALAADMTGREHTPKEDGNGIERSSYYWGMQSPSRFICDLENFFIIPNDVKNDIKDGLIRIKQKMASDLCGWKSMCRFAVEGSSDKCVPDIWQVETRYIRQDQCNNFKPTITCNQDDCGKTCDKHWPWAQSPPDCATMPCGSFVSRGKEFHGVKSREVEEKLKKYCPHVIGCPCLPDAPIDKNLTRRIEETKKETSQLTTNSIIIIVCVIVIVVLMTIAALIGLVVFLKKEKAEKSVKDTKMDAILQATSIITAHMSRSTMQNQGGGVTSTADDLSDRETSKKPINASVSPKNLNPIQSMASGKKK